MSSTQRLRNFFFHSLERAQDIIVDCPTTHNQWDQLDYIVFRQNLHTLLATQSLYMTDDNTCHSIDFEIVQTQPTALPHYTPQTLPPESQKSQAPSACHYCLYSWSYRPIRSGSLKGKFATTLSPCLRTILGKSLPSISLIVTIFKKSGSP